MCSVCVCACIYLCVTGSWAGDPSPCLCLTCVVCVCVWVCVSALFTGTGVGDIFCHACVWCVLCVRACACVFVCAYVCVCLFVCYGVRGWWHPSPYLCLTCVVCVCVLQGLGLVISFTLPVFDLCIVCMYYLCVCVCVLQGLGLVISCSLPVFDLYVCVCFTGTGVGDILRHACVWPPHQWDSGEMALLQSLLSCVSQLGSYFVIRFILGSVDETFESIGVAKRLWDLNLHTSGQLYDLALFGGSQESLKEMIEVDFSVSSVHWLSVCCLSLKLVLIPPPPPPPLTFYSLF